MFGAAAVNANAESTRTRERIRNLPRQLPPPENSLPDWEDEFTRTRTRTRTDFNSQTRPGTGPGGNGDEEPTSTCTTETKTKQSKNTASGTTTSSNTYDSPRDMKMMHNSITSTSTLVTSTETAHFENLPPDISAHILSYNTLSEIVHTYSILSKSCHLNGYLNETTWKLKFVQRYNAAHMVDPIHEIYGNGGRHDNGNGNGNDDGNHTQGWKTKSGRSNHVFWRRVYRAAYLNPHDLWLTHWNCTLPMDGIAQGRCSVPDVAFKSRPKTKERSRSRSNADSDVKVKAKANTKTDTSSNENPRSTSTPDKRTQESAGDADADTDEEGETCTVVEDPNDGIDNGSGNNYGDGDNGERDGGDTKKPDETNHNSNSNNNNKTNVSSATTGTTRTNLHDENEEVDKILKDRHGEKCPTCRYHPLLDGGALFREAMIAEVEFEQREKAKAEAQAEAEVEQATKAMAQAQARPEQVPTKLDSDPTIVHEYMTAILSQSIEEEDALGNCLGYATPSEVIRRSTQFSLSKWCRRMRAEHNLDLRNEQPWEFRFDSDDDDDNGGDGDINGGADNHDDEEQEQDVVDQEEASCHVQSYSHSPFMERRRREARRAFEKASTFHRSINAEQYRSSGLNFMTDAVFFPIEPCHEKLETLSSARVANGSGRAGAGTCTHSSQMSELEHSILDLYGTTPPVEEGDMEDVHTNANAGPDDDPPPDPLNDMKYTRVFDEGTLAGLGPKFETAQHSWHVVRLTNPDYERPIAFRIYIQRPECYCAYPSEGFLKPGETAYVTLGVRALGSLMAKAYDCTDTLREENPLFLSDILEEESFLPLNGFAIRYITAPALPCVPVPFYRSSDANWSSSSIDPSLQRGGDFAECRDDGLVNRMWCNLQTEGEIRTIHVSTHVHGMYSFDQFQNLTMVPFDVRQKRFNFTWLRNRAAVMYAPLTLMCPLLQRKDPRVFSDIHDMELEMDPCSEGFCYRTEKKCACCGRDWGARCEYLGRAFALRKAVCNENLRKRSRQIHRSVECLKIIPDLYETFLDEMDDADVDTVLNKLQQLLFCVRAVIVYARGDKLMTRRQIEMLTSYELYENILSENLASYKKYVSGDTSTAFSFAWKGKTDTFWRLSGIYGAPRVSEDEKDEQFSNERELGPYVKHEPRYLKQLKAMSHHKGYYDIGKMEDPNHPEKDDCYDIDMVGNSLKFGARAAMSLIQSPKSIQGHGAYELSMYPGVILKSRLPHADSFLRVHENNDIKLKGFASRVIGKMKKKYPQRRCVLHRMSGSVRDKSWAPLHINDLDPGGYHLIMFQRSREMKEKYNVSSLTNMNRNVPDPGCGRYSLSIISGSEGNAKVIPMFPFLNVPTVRNMGRMNSSGGGHQNDQPIPAVGGLRVLNSVWYVCDLFGLKVVDESAPGIVMLDRRMMIAVQWLSFTLMVFPLLWSLVARWAGWIPTHPTDYILKGLSSSTHKEMRYLSSFECGVLAIILSVLYIFLGRCAERYTLRTFERVMVDDFSRSSATMPHSSESKLKNFMSSYQDLVDRCIPIYLQRIFWRSPGWNFRSRRHIQRHILKKRSVDDRENRSILHAESGQQRGDRILKQRPVMRSSTKGGLCVLIGLCSFSSCSPNYSLNLCTVFFCSIATGLSISINHMETTRTPRGKSVISSFDNMNFQTAVVMFFLIGQVVGSSGGIQFLAEFVVTAVGLLLGGAATVSTAGIESWLSFFGLSSTAFWGYFLARVGLASSVRFKKCGLASGLLMCSLVVMTILLVGTIKSAEDELPTKLMILRYDSLSAGGSAIAVLAGRHLLT